jgi:hypothetical protein
VEWNEVKMFLKKHILEKPPLYLLYLDKCLPNDSDAQQVMAVFMHNVAAAYYSKTNKPLPLTPEDVVVISKKILLQSFTGVQQSSMRDFVNHPIYPPCDNNHIHGQGHNSFYGRFRFALEIAFFLSTSCFDMVIKGEASLSLCRHVASIFQEFGHFLAYSKSVQVCSLSFIWCFLIQN